MKKRRYTEEQIAFCIEAGRDGHAGGGIDPPDEDFRADFYRWKMLYGGLAVGELRGLKEPVANLRLDKHILRTPRIAGALSDRWRPPFTSGATWSDVIHSALESGV